MANELIFEKEYELLQEITYAYKGNPRTVKKVLLKAPTFKQAEKLETALSSLNPVVSIINFIADAGLLLSKEDQTPLSSPILSDLHVQAYRNLANEYVKFFLTPAQSEIENKNEN